MASVQITTRYRPATDHHGSRIQATATDGGMRRTIYVPFDHAAGIWGSHLGAAREMVKRLGLARDPWIVTDHGPGYVFTMADPRSAVTL